MNKTLVINERSMIRIKKMFLSLEENQYKIIKINGIKGLAKKITNGYELNSAMISIIALKKYIITKKLTLFFFIPLAI
jgi:endo-1,4-beta-D-glucanase Y